MPSIEDHVALRGPATPSEAARAWLALGPTEVVIKMGEEGALVASAAGEVRVPAASPTRIIDTPAAGDSFNAAYVAARLFEGLPAAEAARRGAALAQQG